MAGRVAFLLMVLLAVASADDHGYDKPDAEPAVGGAIDGVVAGVGVMTEPKFVFKWGDGQYPGVCSAEIGKVSYEITYPMANGPLWFLVFDQHRGLDYWSCDNTEQEHKKILLHPDNTESNNCTEADGSYRCHGEFYVSSTEYQNWYFAVAACKAGEPEDFYFSYKVEFQNLEKEDGTFRYLPWVPYSSCMETATSAAAAGVSAAYGVVLSVCMLQNLASLLSKF